MSVRTVAYVSSPWYVRGPAYALIWGAWTYAYGAVIWYHATTKAALHTSLPGDLACFGLFAWLILLDDPPANYGSYGEWWRVRKERLSRRRYPFTPLPR